jgi:carbon-monoxide dehydrogenase large subunit
VVDRPRLRRRRKTQVHAEARTILLRLGHLGDKGRDEAFAKAAKHVTRLDTRQQPAGANPMEPRVAVGDYDQGRGRHTLYTTSQNPHVAASCSRAFIGIAPENKLRVIAPDVGGGFGSKIFIYAEETVCLWAAKKLGRPVKWTCSTGPRPSSPTRMAATMSPDRARHGRRPRCWRCGCDTTANLGAYLSTFSSSVPTYLYAHAALGQLRHPGDLCEREGGLHQHRPGRRLSRRGPPGSDLCGGASGGRPRASWAWIRPSCAAELHHRVPAPDTGDHDV